MADRSVDVLEDVYIELSNGRGVNRVHWPKQGNNMRRVKVPAAPGGRYVGLVLLFSSHTGEPLAIMPDGVMQRIRVSICPVGPDEGHRSKKYAVEYGRRLRGET